jgi:creatinine amidohydrolase
VPGLQLGDLTSAEIGRLAGEGRVIGLIGTGAVEQHGPHLPLATDAIIARHLAGEIAERLAETVLVAPILPGGLSSHHLGFPGTVDLAPEVFSGFVRAYLAMYDALGVRDVALFSAHGGNFGALAELAEEYAGHERLRVVGHSDMGAYVQVMLRAAAGAGLEVPETDIHAGGLETSQILHLVGEDRITVAPDLEGYVAAEPGWLERLMVDGIKAVSPNGVLGRPAGATAAAGQAICTALADELAAWIAEQLELEPSQRLAASAG